MTEITPADVARVQKWLPENYSITLGSGYCVSIRGLADALEAAWKENERKQVDPPPHKQFVIQMRERVEKAERERDATRELLREVVFRESLWDEDFRNRIDAVLGEK